MVAPQCGLRRGHSNAVGNKVRPYLCTRDRSPSFCRTDVGDIFLADNLESMMTLIQNPRRVDIDRSMKSHATTS